MDSTVYVFPFLFACFGCIYIYTRRHKASRVSKPPMSQAPTASPRQLELLVPARRDASDLPVHTLLQQPGHVLGGQAALALPDALGAEHGVLGHEAEDVGAGGEQGAAGLEARRRGERGADLAHLIRPPVGLGGHADQAALGARADARCVGVELRLQLRQDAAGGGRGVCEDRERGEALGQAGEAGFECRGRAQVWGDEVHVERVEEGFGEEGFVRAGERDGGHCPRVCVCVGVGGRVRVSVGLVKYAGAGASTGTGARGICRLCWCFVGGSLGFHRGLVSGFAFLLLLVLWTERWWSDDPAIQETDRDRGRRRSLFSLLAHHGQGTCESTCQRRARGRLWTRPRWRRLSEDGPDFGHRAWRDGVEVDVNYVAGAWSFGASSLPRGPLACVGHPLGDCEGVAWWRNAEDDVGLGHEGFVRCGFFDLCCSDPFDRVITGHVPLASLCVHVHEHCVEGRYYLLPAETVKTRYP